MRRPLAKIVAAVAVAVAIAVTAAGAVAGAAGCAGQPGPVKLSTGWPASPGDYDAAYHKWTRQGSARRDLSLMIDVSATLESAEWRAAWVAARAKSLSLTEDERSKLAAEQEKAAKDVWQVELIVVTASSTWQDFAAVRSMWRLALVGDGGREVLPTSVKADGRSRGELEVWFPALKGMWQAYVVTFPAVGADNEPLVREGGAKLTLEVAGAQGKVELVWQGE